MSYMDALVAEYKNAAPNQQRRNVRLKNQQIVKNLLKAEVEAKKRTAWFFMTLFKRIVGRR